MEHVLESAQALFSSRIKDWVSTMASDLVAIPHQESTVDKIPTMTLTTKI